MTMALPSGRIGPILSVCLLAAAGAACAAPVPLPTKPPAAMGYDWMDAPDRIDAGDDPDPWPRADAADTGMDDMIRIERHALDEGISGGAGQPGRVEAGQDTRILRTLRKVGGDYIVLPVFTLHLDRAPRP